MKKANNDKNLIKKPQFRIDLELIRTDGWTRFVRSPAEPTYWFLLTYIIREDVNTGGFDLYKDGYVKNMLVSRWSQENIAANLNITQGTVSKHITELEEMECIKKHQKALYGKLCCFYQLGVHDGNGYEELFLEKALRDELKEKRLLESEATIKRLLRNPDDFENWKKRANLKGQRDGAIFQEGISPYSPAPYIELQKPLELQKQNHCSKRYAAENTFSKKNGSAAGSAQTTAPVPPYRSTRKVLPWRQ